MRKLLQNVLISLTVAVLPACSESPELKDGYQPGDGIRMTRRHYDEYQQWKAQYCEKAKGYLARQIALDAIRIKYPMIPENGICGNVRIVVDE